LLSGVLCEKCVQAAYVDHAVDNLSDHDQILLHVGLDVQYVGFAEKVYTPRASWKKASDLDLSNYRSAVSRNLYFHTEVITCHDMNCNNSQHFSVITDYVKCIKRYHRCMHKCL